MTKARTNKVVCQKKWIRYAAIFIFFLLNSITVIAQIMYQNVSNKMISFGSYGRVGVDWSYENVESISQYGKSILSADFCTHGRARYLGQTTS
jgi:hypothetical protein